MLELIENVELLSHNIIKVIWAIIIIAMCQIIFCVFEYVKRKRENKVINNVEFALFVKVHMLSFFLSVIYVGFYSLLSKSNIALLLIILFYWFVIYIVKMQNESNGGYVTEWNDLSGTILFVAATLQPCLVIVFYILNIIYHKWMIKREEESYSDRNKKIRKRILDIVETLVLWLLVSIIPMNTFVETIFWNSILISFFSLALPPINETIFSWIEKDENMKKE